jgi:hypothetical protein
MVDSVRCQCHDAHCVFQVLLSVICVETLIFDWRFRLYWRQCSPETWQFFLFYFNDAICCIFKFNFVSTCLFIFYLTLRLWVKLYRIKWQNKNKQWTGKCVEVNANDLILGTIAEFALNVWRKQIRTCYNSSCPRWDSKGYLMKPI